MTPRPFHRPLTYICHSEAITTRGHCKVSGQNCIPLNSAVCPCATILPKIFPYLLKSWNSVVSITSMATGYKIKHEDMQTAFTKICERMGCSQVLSKFQCGTVIGPV